MLGQGNSHHGSLNLPWGGMGGLRDQFLYSDFKTRGVLSLSTLQSREKLQSMWLAKVSSSSSSPQLPLFFPFSFLLPLFRSSSSSCFSSSSSSLPNLSIDPFLRTLYSPTSSALLEAVFVLIHLGKHLWSAPGVPVCRAESGKAACKITQVRPLVFLRTNAPLSPFPENYAVPGRLLGSQVRSQSYAQGL